MGESLTLLMLVAALAAPDDKVVITHYGGPDFVIEDGSTVIYVDPLPPNAPNFIRHFKAFRKTNDPPPDLVLITHSHNDHCNVPALQQLAKLNPQLRVIAPVDTHDVLDPIFRPEQLVAPIPKPGQPATVLHGHVKVRVYRSLHGWLTDDRLPYNLTFPFHHTYVIETKGRRILISGDGYDFRGVAKDFTQIDAVLWHIYKPSDIFDFQAMQPLLRPSYVVPHHLNIRYGLQQQEMAALTDRYHFQDVNVVYLTEGNNSLLLRKNNAASAPSFSTHSEMEFDLQVDRLFRGIQEPNTIQVLAHVRNPGMPDFGGEVSLEAPEGWEVKSLEATAFPRLGTGRDFLCRFRVKGPADLKLDGRREYGIRGHLLVSGRRETRDLRFGAGTIYTWNILGPFDNSDGEGDKRVYPPEEGVELKKTYVGRYDAPLRWIPYASRDLHAGYIDLSGAFSIAETFGPMPAASNPQYIRTHERLVGFAMVYIDSPSEREAIFHGGAPYGMQIFLNGKRLFEMPGYDFNFHFDQFRIPARLNAGRNTVLVKITRGELPETNLSPWTGFCLRVTDGRGQPFQDLTFPLE
jgi:L-ascorbate metabolism protein UlaG (beta-lactamase superfamily)